MKKRNKRAFTLIELLVVIAIIALLFAIIMPSLQLAKMKAAGAVCASRQHYAILSYTLYADDNDSHLVNSDTMVSGTLCFVEETEMDAGYNKESWAMNVTDPFMWDPLAVLHGNSSTLGFVDGHAEVHKWRTDIIIEMFKKGEKWLNIGDGLTYENEDYKFLRSIFPYERTIE